MPDHSVLTEFSLPGSSEIRRTAAEILSNSKYDLDANAPESSLLQKWIFEKIDSLLEPLRHAFEALSEISPWLAWTITFLLIAILVALIVHTAYMFRLALRGRSRAQYPDPREVDPRRLPETWERKAREALAAQDYIGAVRFLFRAGLLRLEDVRKGTFRFGKTNREYLKDFSTTAASEPLHVFVETIDTKWYGGGVCSHEEYRLCEEAYSVIETAADGMKNAERP